MKIAAPQHAEIWANGRRIPDPANAAKEFEAFLVAEVWKQGQKGPRWSKLLGDGSAEAMTRSMWIDELVGRAVAQRGLGLAESLRRSSASPSPTESEDTP